MLGNHAKPRVRRGQPQQALEPDIPNGAGNSPSARTRLIKDQRFCLARCALKARILSGHPGIRVPGFGLMRGFTIDACGGTAGTARRFAVVKIRAGYRRPFIGNWPIETDTEAEPNDDGRCSAPRPYGWSPK